MPGTDLPYAATSLLLLTASPPTTNLPRKSTPGMTQGNIHVSQNGASRRYLRSNQGHRSSAHRTRPSTLHAEIKSEKPHLPNTLYQMCSVFVIDFAACASPRSACGADVGDWTVQSGGGRVGAVRTRVYVVLTSLYGTTRATYRRCAPVSSATGLRACYAMPGTDIADRAVPEWGRIRQ
eukprot:2075903-Rhodomonas_salina.1